MVLMERSDVGALIAALGMLLLALAQTGGPVFSDHPQFGTYLGMGLIIAGGIVATALNEYESD